MAEDVQQHSISLRDYPRCRAVVFWRFQKIGLVDNEWYSEWVSEFLQLLISLLTYPIVTWIVHRRPGWSQERLFSSPSHLKVFSNKFSASLYEMFETVRFFRGYRRCFICCISRIPEGCLLREYSIFSNYSDFRRSPKMNVPFVELVGFPNTDFLNDVRFDVAFLKIFWAGFSDSARVEFPEIGCSTMFNFSGGYHR